MDYFFNLFLHCFQSTALTIYYNINNENEKVWIKKQDKSGRKTIKATQAKK